MDTEPLIQNILFISINWICIFFFPLLMRYLMSRSIHQNNVNAISKNSESFWSGYDPFSAITTSNRSSTDLSLILFRKSISLLALSFVALFMAYWASTENEMGTFYIISSFLMFMFYVKSLSMFNQLTFTKFAILTGILVVSFLVLFYVNPVAYFIFCLGFNLFISPLYMFYLNKRSLKLDFWLFSCAYFLNLLTFVSITLFLGSAT
ncbi:MAG: hypothetical protein N4Q30_03655, partial [Neisseriaceae bacterium]|nr:hypothetical protein [Neisseriaceae bacterium]